MSNVTVTGTTINVRVTPPPPNEVTVNMGGSAGTGQAWLSAGVTEAPDGTRRTFSTPSAYVAGALIVYLNGLRESHITEATATTFTFSEAPVSGDQISVFYRTT